MKDLIKKFTILLTLSQLLFIPMTIADDSDEQTDTTEEALETTDDKAAKVDFSMKESDKHEDENFLYAATTLMVLPAVAVAYFKTMGEGSCYSTYIFMAATAYYFFKEVSVWEEFKGGSDHALVTYENVEVDNQVEALKTAKEENDLALEAIKQKQENAKYAAIGIAVAAAAALIEAMLEKSPAKYCLNGQCPVDSYKKISSVIEEKDSNLFKNLADTKVSSTIDNSYDNNLDYFINFSDRNSDRIHSLTHQQYRELKKSSEAKDLPSTDLLKAFTKKMSNMIFPQAHALQQLEKIGIVGGAALSYMAYKYADGLMTADSLWGKSYTRAAAFAACAGIAYMAMNEYEEVIQDLESRSKKYQYLIDRLLGSTLAPNLANGAQLVYESDKLANGILPDPYKNGKEESDLCLQETGDGSIVPISCDRCNETNTCKTSSVPDDINFPQVGAPESLSESAASMQSMEDAAYSGDLQAAEIAANALGQNATNIKELRAKIEEKINTKRVKDKKKPLDFGGMKAKMTRDIQKLAHQNLAALPSKYSNFKDLIDLGGAAKIDKDKKLGASKAGKDANKKAGNEKEKDPLAGMNFEIEDDKKENFGLKRGESYAYNKNAQDDILKDKNTNIFEVISVRYLKTAYPVFLEQEK